MCPPVTQMRVTGMSPAHHILSLTSPSFLRDSLMRELVRGARCGEPMILFIGNRNKGYLCVLWGHQRVPKEDDVTGAMVCWPLCILPH